MSADETGLCRMTSCWPESENLHLGVRAANHQDPEEARYNRRQRDGTAGSPPSEADEAALDMLSRPDASPGYGSAPIGPLTVSPKWRQAIPVMSCVKPQPAIPTNTSPRPLNMGTDDAASSCAMDTRNP